MNLLFKRANELCIIDMSNALIRWLAFALFTRQAKWGWLMLIVWYELVEFMGEEERLTIGMLSCLIPYLGKGWGGQPPGTKMLGDQLGCVYKKGVPEDRADPAPWRWARNGF